MTIAPDKIDLNKTDYSREELDAIKEVFSKSVYWFARHFFPHLLNKKIPEFHKEIYEQLLKRLFLAVEAFRGGAKSTIGLIIYPIWYALFDGRGDISLVSMSEGFVLNEITRKIRWEFENNRYLIKFFGNMKTDKWSEGYFTLANGISFEGKGIEGQLRGGRRGLIALDDLEDNTTVLSEEQRDKLRQSVFKELIPKLLPQGQMCYFGTPIHPLCFLHQIIKTPNNGWFKLVFDSYKDGVEAEGHEAWPEMLNHTELMKRKALMGSTCFSAEYRVNPIADEKMPIKEEYIRVWSQLPAQYSAVIVVDPAYSEDEAADYKVAALVGIDHLANRYLLHYIRTHDSLTNFMNGILNLWQSHRTVVTGIGIPNSGVEKGFFHSFMKLCDEKKLYPPVIELKNSFTNATTSISVRNKKSRIVAALQPLFEQGKYYIHADHLEARDELLTIGVSRHDDLVDCMAYAESIIQPIFYEEQNSGDSYYDLDLKPAYAGNYGL